MSRDTVRVYMSSDDEHFIEEIIRFMGDRGYILCLKGREYYITRIEFEKR